MYFPLPFFMAIHSFICFFCNIGLMRMLPTNRAVRIGRNWPPPSLMRISARMDYGSSFFFLITELICRRRPSKKAQYMVASESREPDSSDKRCVYSRFSPLLFPVLMLFSRLQSNTSTPKKNSHQPKSSLTKLTKAEVVLRTPSRSSDG